MLLLSPSVRALAQGGSGGAVLRLYVMNETSYGTPSRAMRVLRVCNARGEA